MFASLFGFQLELCSRCLSNEEHPALATPELVTSRSDEDAHKKAREAGKGHVCPLCKEPLDNEEVLDRDEIIQLILMSLEPSKVREATLKVVESKREASKKLKEASEERARQREEKRAKDEADGVEYVRKVIFRERVKKEKTDEEDNCFDDAWYFAGWRNRICCGASPGQF